MYIPNVPLGHIIIAILIIFLFISPVIVLSEFFHREEDDIKTAFQEKISFAAKIGTFFFGCIIMGLGVETLLSLITSSYIVDRGFERIVHGFSFFVGIIFSLSITGVFLEYRKMNAEYQKILSIFDKMLHRFSLLRRRMDSETLAQDEEEEFDKLNEIFIKYKVVKKIKDLEFFSASLKRILTVNEGYNALYNLDLDYEGEHDLYMGDNGEDEEYDVDTSLIEDGKDSSEKEEVQNIKKDRQSGLLQNGIDQDYLEEHTIESCLSMGYSKSEILSMGYDEALVNKIIDKMGGE